MGRGTAAFRLVLELYGMPTIYNMVLSVDVRITGSLIWVYEGLFHGCHCFLILINSIYKNYGLFFLFFFFVRKGFDAWLLAFKWGDDNRVLLSCRTLWLKVSQGSKFQL